MLVVGKIKEIYNSSLTKDRVSHDFFHLWPLGRKPSPCDGRNPITNGVDEDVLGTPKATFTEAEAKQTKKYILKKVVPWGSPWLVGVDLFAEKKGFFQEEGPPMRNWVVEMYII